MDKLPDYQVIEDAYKGVAEVIGKLPQNDWSGRALDHLQISEKAAYQARERAKADRTEEVSGPAADASVALHLGQATFTAAVTAARSFEALIEAGTPYIVGDSGCELIAPSNHGYIAPNSAIETRGPAVTGWPWKRCDNCMVIANWDTIMRGRHHGNCAAGWPTEGVME